MRLIRFMACACSAATLFTIASTASAAAPELSFGERLAAAYEEPALYADGTDPSTDARVIPVDGVTTFETTTRFQNHNRRVLYIRPVANPSGKVPAILMLHYSGGTPEKMANLTAVSQLVHDYGIWVILPEGVNRRWSDDPVRDAHRTDDSTFLANVIDASVAAYPVDAHRIYAAGFSLGGFMTERFLCDHSERIAAAAWVSATLLNTQRANCALTNTTPVMTFHGTKDPRVNYNGQVGYASAPDTAAYFAGRNGCASPPVRTDLPNTANDGTTVYLDTYSSCSSSDPVRFYTITGGGHTWPGNNYQGALLGRTTHDIDATSLLWSFFQNYSR